MQKLLCISPTNFSETSFPLEENGRVIQEVVTPSSLLSPVLPGEEGSPPIPIVEKYFPPLNSLPHHMVQSPGRI
jgi:hypothetical protein